MRPDVPDLDVARMTAAFERRVDDVCPADRGLAARTLASLPVTRWTLEWRLPVWLGEAYELDAGTTDAITLSNILGLVALRLEDDLRDGEVLADDLVAARRLSGTLLAEAIRPYERWFDPPSPFWPYLRNALRGWRRAATGPMTRPFKLSARAAPDKVAAFAICQLTGHDRSWRQLERCLDLALRSLVRADQVADWEGDLDAGRWNAFVAAVTDGTQSPAYRERNRSAVRAAILTRDSLSHELRTAASDASAAAKLAARLQCPPLAGFLMESATNLDKQADRVSAHYRAVTDRVVGLIFGPVMQ